MSYMHVCTADKYEKSDGFALSPFKQSSFSQKYRQQRDSRRSQDMDKQITGLEPLYP